MHVHNNISLSLSLYIYIYIHICTSTFIITFYILRLSRPLRGPGSPARFALSQTLWTHDIYIYIYIYIYIIYIYTYVYIYIYMYLFIYVCFIDLFICPQTLRGSGGREGRGIALSSLLLLLLLLCLM